MYTASALVCEYTEFYSMWHVLGSFCAGGLMVRRLQSARTTSWATQGSPPARKPASRWTTDSCCTQGAHGMSFSRTRESSIYRAGMAADVRSVAGPGPPDYGQLSRKIVKTGTSTPASGPCFASALTHTNSRWLTKPTCGPRRVQGGNITSPVAGIGYPGPAGYGNTEFSAQAVLDSTPELWKPLPCFILVV